MGGEKRLRALRRLKSDGFLCFVWDTIFFFLGEGIAGKGYDLCAIPRCYSFLPSSVSFIFL